MSAKEVTATNGKLRLLSLYGDLPASVHARWVAGRIARLAGPHWQTTSEMWKIDSLQVSEPIRKMIVNDAANADVIIIAASSWAQSEPALIQWLKSVEACKTGRLYCSLAIGLLGDEETTAADLSCVVTPLIHSLQQANKDFIWRGMGNGAMNDSNWFAGKVEELLVRKSWFEVFGKSLARLTSSRGFIHSLASPALSAEAREN